MKRIEDITENPAQTKKIGETLARKILKKGLLESAVLVFLEGTLGAGKTTFLQGFAKGLGIKEKILSPTFIILKRFNINDSEFKNFYHIDCYRIQRPEEILELGFKNMVSNPQNIVAIEWPERIRNLLPKNGILVKFKAIDKNKRSLLLLR